MNSEKLDSSPSCIPARMLNEFVYCPRLAYIEWVQGDFAENYETVEGRHQHRVVDAQISPLPTQAEPDELLHARSVWLSAPKERITAKIDLVESQGTMATPIDYKRGAPPSDKPVWDADAVQICAQALVLRANGFTCTKGAVYYRKTRHRVEIPINEEIVRHTREAVAGLLRAAESASIPAPLVDSPKCVRCSLAAICMPDEVDFLTRQDEQPSRIRKLLPSSDDALPLYVQEQGARIAKRGEALEIMHNGSKLAESRLFETSHIALFGNVQISSQALAAALDRQIPVAFFSTGGWFRGMAVGGLGHKNAELRLAQFATALDEAKSLKLAQQFVAAKIANSRTLLRRNSKRDQTGELAELKALASRATSAESASELLGLEGRAARVYYSGFGKLLKHAKGANLDTFDFNGRNRRPPCDPVNALLSYAYSLLSKDAAVAALSVGFDPYVGFFHRPRYGRPALALDLMEEFRPLIADSTVLTLVNGKALTRSDFIRQGQAVVLSRGGRRRFLEAYEQRLSTLITHPIFGYKISYRQVLEIQARLLARSLAGELPSYPGFRTR